jgi:hypothetical protein
MPSPPGDFKVLIERPVRNTRGDMQNGSYDVRAIIALQARGSCNGFLWNNQQSIESMRRDTLLFTSSDNRALLNLQLKGSAW